MVTFGKRASPMMGKLSKLLAPGHRWGLLDAGVSLRNPLDHRVRSPSGLKKYDLGGIGLGIVAALEKSGGYKYIIAGSNPIRSTSIPLNPVKNNNAIGLVAPRRGCDFREFDEEEEEEEEKDYTFVTRHGLSNKSFTRVYYDGCEIGRAKRANNNMGIFEIAIADRGEEFSENPGRDFLSCCSLCKKKLHGKDIYMYRGEKAFCSEECRSSQIMVDERRERCRSEASMSVVDHVSSSAYSRGQIFSIGIVAI